MAKKRYDNVTIKSLVDGSTIEGHEAVQAYFEREQALSAEYGSSLYFQVYRADPSANTLAEFQGKELAEIKLADGTVGGDDTVAAVKALIRPLVEREVGPVAHLTFAFNGGPMEDAALFYADHYMMLPAWIQVVLHDCTRAELDAVIRRLLGR